MEKRFVEHAGKLQQLTTRVSERLRELEAQTPAKLAAEVAELSEAVQKHADTHRRFAGRVWAAVQHGPARSTDNGVEDDELAAMLALQTAKPPPPN